MNPSSSITIRKQLCEIKSPKMLNSVAAMDQAQRKAITQAVLYVNYILFELMRSEGENITNKTEFINF